MYLLVLKNVYFNYKSFDLHNVDGKMYKIYISKCANHCYHEKKPKKKVENTSLLEINTLDGDFSLYLDGAYKRKEEKAIASVVIFDPMEQKVMERGIDL